MFKEVGGTVFYVRNLGGPGSGNFGHAGRPGERGGSAHSGEGEGKSKEPSIAEKYNRVIRDGVAKGFAAKTENLTIEHAFILDSNNKPIATFIGDEKHVSIPKETALKDAHLIHNHPGETYPTLSDQDIITAIKRDMGSITATGIKGIMTIDRPANGWPKVDPESIRSKYKEYGNELRDRLTNIANKGEVVTREMVHGGMQEIAYSTASDIGLKVRYVKR